MVEGLTQAVIGFLVELGDADVADVAALEMRAHRLHVNDLADDRVFLRLLVGAALDEQPHARLRRPAHLVDRLLQREALDGRVVDAGDEVARHESGAGGRRVVDRAHDLDEAVLHHDLEPEAAEFLALHAGLEILQRLGVEIGRMRIERGEHAVDRRL